jgi:hypothetical protein
MTRKLHQALEAVVPHVEEGSQIFIVDRGNYHRFRVEGGSVAHRSTHSSSHVERGRGPLQGGRESGRTAGPGPGGTPGREGAAE